jgi:hypothetical protein
MDIRKTMKKKRSKKITKANKSSNNEFLKLEKQIEKDVVQVEKWIQERKKFFIKLGIVIILIVLLLIISNILVSLR